MENIDNSKDLDEMMKKSDVFIVDFTATWCAPCKGMKKMLRRIEKDFPEVDIAVVDIDKAEDLAKEFEIEAVPTYLLYRKGKLVFRDEGTPITYGRFIKKLGL